MKQNQKTNVELPELLAPVGGWPQLVAAVNNGADAVYMGGSLFNARMKADNFAGDNLRRAIDYAHERNVKVYITLNTLIKERELGKAFDYACDLYDAGADAVILQDMGLARLIHKHLPDLHMHLSTQGTVYNAQALDLVREMGFQRVVPARELTLAEIENLCAAARGGSSSPIEIEVFVHGALCMCYSGQCQMSRLLGASGQMQSGADGSVHGGNKDEILSGISGRSGNRGLCAQPCRLPYTDDQGRETYALSPKDICTIERIPQLVEAGVDSFKIEGRLKTPEYVAVVTGIYRKYLDRYAELMQKNGKLQNFPIDPEDRQKLLQIFSRGGFCTGYLDGNPGTHILSGRSPKNQGIRVGKVAAVQKVKSSKRKEERFLVDVKLDRGCGISIGDGVEFADTGNVVTYLKELPDHIVRIGDFAGFASNHASNHASNNRPGEGGDAAAGSGIRAGVPVFKVTDKALLDEAALTFTGEAGAESDRNMRRRTPVKMHFTGHVGETPSLVMTADDGPVAVWSDKPIEKALKRPADPQRIRQQLAKLGGTPFTADAAEPHNGVRGGKTGEQYGGMHDGQASEWIELDVDGDAMIPVSLINELRRAAVEQLLAGRRDKKRQPADRKCPELRNKEQDGQPREDAAHRQPSEDAVRPENSTSIFRGDCILVPLEQFMDGAFANGKPGLSVTGCLTIPYILNVSKGALDEYIESHFEEIVEAVRETGIAVGNLGWARQFLSAGVKVYGDYGLNIFNSQSAEAFAEMGIEPIAWSDEMSDDGRHWMAGLDGIRIEGIKREPAIMERIPLMITEHPLQSGYLTDRKGVKHAIFKWYSGDKYLIF